MMKEQICEAFCASLEVSPVPAGFAIRTPYENSDGDPILLYLIRDTHSKWRIEDDGTQVPLLEAHGVDLTGRARGEAFSILLEEYGAHFDADARTVSTRSMLESELGPAAVKFVGLLLRIQDLALLSPQIVRSSFREDAIEAIHAALDSVAHVNENKALSSDFIGHEADLIITAKQGDLPPLALFLATSEERALLALVAKMEAEKYRRIDGKVALMVEYSKNNPIKEYTYSLAHARLDSVLSFRGAQKDSIQRLAQLAGVESPVGILQ